jgi:hypothetical protein
MFDPKPINIDTDSAAGWLKLFLKHLKKKSILFLGLAVAFSIASMGWHWYSKPSYLAKCTFVLEEKSSGVGGLAGIASQMGIDLGGLTGGSSNFFSGENISDIINSSTILDQVLLSKVDSTYSLADLYLDASGMRNGWGWNGKLKSLNFTAENNDQSLIDTALLVIRNRIKKSNLVVDRANKKGTIYSVEVTSADPVFAKQLTERLVSATSNMYIDIKTRNITAHIAQLEQRADSLRSLFGAKAREAYSYQLLDANQAFKNSLASSEISSKDKTVLFELYAEVMKNLELSHLLLINQTPVVQILDKPNSPLVDSRYSVLKLIAFSIGASLVITLLISLISFKTPNTYEIS